MNNSQTASVHRAVNRARWLAELAAALDLANRLLLRMGRSDAGAIEAMMLRGQIVALRGEVDSLRRGRRPVPDEVDPLWMQ